MLLMMPHGVDTGVDAGGTQYPWPPCPALAQSGFAWSPSHRANKSVASTARYVEDGRMTLLDVREERKYQAYYHGQQVYLDDCIHRTRGLSEWTLFCDLDEYLYHSAPHDSWQGPRTPPGGLAAADTIVEQFKDHKYFRMYDYMFSVRRCLPENATSHIANPISAQHIPYRAIKATVAGEKWMARTGEVVLAGIHMAVELAGGLRKRAVYIDAHVSPDVLHIKHMRGLISRNGTCDTIVTDLRTTARSVLDTDMLVYTQLPSPIIKV
eukprot:SM000016S01959  [mRNA]  locus=s16:920935:921850:+ [translate_table: standard]